jgi:hypothetical protein
MQAGKTERTASTESGLKRQGGPLFSGGAADCQTGFSSLRESRAGADTGGI